MNSPAPTRLHSLDVYRGFVMFLMAAEVLHTPEVAEHFKGNSVWDFLRFHTSHVPWAGCSLHDMIQPSFSFMVGVALPFSIASRLTKGASKAQMWGHALWRAFCLVMLGVVLRSMGEPQTYWTFEDTLSQIGLGYPLLFALGFVCTRTRWITLAAILVGYWLLFATWSGTGGTPPDWKRGFTGFAAHWNLNANAAWAFDTWFLNLFPRAAPFTGNEGGYCTLSFIPTLGTMLLGLIAGQWIKDRTDDMQLVKRLLVAGAIALGIGYLWHFSGLCPSVKKIWTPAWTLVSGGYCMGLMALFFYLVDVLGWRRWAFFFTVIGMNSIAMYVMSWTTHEFFGSMLHTHFGRAPFLILGKPFEPMLHGACIFAILWLILLWMHRKNIYIRL